MKKVLIFITILSCSFNNLIIENKVDANTQSQNEIVNYTSETSLTGGSLSDDFKGVAATSDGGYVAVGSSYSSNSGDITDVTRGSGDGLIAKYDSNGNLEYTKLVGGSGFDKLTSVAVTSDGGYVAVGESRSSNSGDITDINKGSSDGLVVKYDSDGNLEYTKLTGGDSFDFFEDVIATSDGGFFVAGRSYSSNSGDIVDSNYGNGDGLIAKYDSNGDLEYTKLVGGSSYEYLYSAVEANDGGYLVAGSSNSSNSGDITDVSRGDSDAFIAKFDANGNLEYTKLIGGSSTDDIFSLTKTEDGGYLGVGRSSSSNSGDITDVNKGDIDGFIIKLNSDGDLEYTKLSGGSDFESFYGIIETTNGSYKALGCSTSSNNGDITDINKGDNDLLIASYNNTGGLEYTKLIGGNDGECAIDADILDDGSYVAVGYSRTSNDGEITDTNAGGSDGVVLTLRKIVQPTIAADDFSIEIGTDLDDEDIIDLSNAIALDGELNDIISNILIDKSLLNVNIASTYKVELSVTDSYGHIAATDIEVEVTAGETEENVEEKPVLPETGFQSRLVLLLITFITLIVLKKKLK